MPGSSFEDIGGCVFDAYGTLFDVHSAAECLRDDIGPVTDALSETWRLKQLQYSWLRGLMGQFEDFWIITSNALDFAMAQHRIDDPALRARLMELYLQLDAFPEVPAVLARLRKDGIKTAILSNGSRSMLVSAAKSAGVYSLFDQILSVDDVGVFKPHPSVYQLAVDRMKLPADRIAFQSSNGWDAHGATVFGFRTVWVNRTAQPPEHLAGTPHAEIRTLDDLPELLGL